MPATVSLREGLFVENSNGFSLIGSECQSCKQMFFPAKKVCLDCYSEDLIQKPLSNTGKLYSFTMVRIPTQNFKAPYAIGWVELSEGVRVFSQIRGWEDTPLKTNMKMVLQKEKLWGEADKDVMGYVFRPVR